MSNLEFKLAIENLSESVSPNRFENKRKNFWCNTITAGFNIAKFFYRFSAEGTENLPKNGPALILPKHQCYSDTVIINSIIKNTTGRFASYLMKSGLPDWMEYLGGFKFITPIDYKKLIDKLGVENARKFTREFNKESYAKLQWFFENNEIVVMYPEGRISPKKMSPIRGGPWRVLSEIQERIEQSIPLIPVGIEYGKLYKEKKPLPPTTINVRFGEPRYLRGNDLEETYLGIWEDIRKLSNL